MKELRFAYNGIMKKINLQNVNLFLGASQTGKTQLLEHFQGVFQGQHKNASYNRQDILKGQFNVRTIAANYTIDDELKMTSKTELLSICKQIIAEFSEYQIEEIKSSLKEAINPLEVALKKNVSFEDNSGFIFDNLLDVVKQYYSFIDTKELSPSLKRYLLLKNVFESPSRGEMVLLIDDFENSFDIEQMLHLVDTLGATDNLSVLIFTKSIELCKLLYNRYPIYIMNMNLCLLSDIFTKYIDEIVNDSGKELAFIIVTEDEISINTTNMLRAYFAELVQLIIANNRDYLINNYKKMNIFHKSDFDILDKFAKFIAGSIV